MQNSNAKQHVINETIDIKISSNNSNYMFNKENTAIYISIFEEYKNKGIIITGTFKDVVWELKDIESNSITKVKFDLEIKQDLILALKFLVLDELKKGLSNSSLALIPSKIIETYIDTDGYDIDYLNDYQDIFNSYGYRKQENIVIKNIQLNDFYKNFIPKEYINFFQSIEIGKRNVRELPDYESVIIFDFVLNDFIKNCTEDNKKKYFPILLWWKITTIIPMRPIEFLDFKSNCVFMKNNKYWITVPRKKNKGNSSRLEITNTIRINKDIYDLVNEYIDLLDTDEKSEYLLSYMAYNSFIKNKTSQKGAISRRLRTDKMDKEQFYELLDDFYIDVVDSIYNYKNIERVKAGDTRHFAFCNMMLQGFNMLTIARIGGHMNLNSQLTYCSHLDYFAEARMKVLANQIKKNRFNQLGDTYLDENNTLIVRSKLYKNTDGGMKIGDNICIDKEFPNNCIKDCMLCPNYILDLTKPNTIKELKLKSNKINNNIKEIINTMQKITKEMIYDLSNISYSQLEQEQLFNLANKLNKMFNEKAMLDSYIENKEND